MRIAVKRIYEPPSAADGVRILVDRLWPRGVSKRKARIDRWLRDVAPSNELRRWYHHDRKQWSGFRRRYFAELRGRPDAVRAIRDAAAGGTVTLLFSSKEPRFNNATALRDYLCRKGKR